MLSRRAWPFWLSWVGLLFGSWALGQRPQVTLELGFDGELIAERWNPLKLTTRDVREAQFSLSLDQGSLREGESLAIYTADLDVSGGVAVFEDDLFLPTWRSLSWTLTTDSEVLASGSLDRRNLDPRPLSLIVSAAPSRWLTSFGPEARVSTIPPSFLPERLAAYDGVVSVLIDGSAAMPNLEAVVAAATAGARVILIEPLPASHAALTALAVGQSALGAGGIYRTDKDALAPLLAASGLPVQALAKALLTPGLYQSPEPPAQLPLLVASGVYLLLVLVLMRLAGAPGLVASLALAALASLAAWTYVRPETSQSLQGRSLVIGSGALSRRDDLRTVFTLPQTTLELAASARPAETVPHAYGPEHFELQLGRWASEAFFLKPHLSDTDLRWENAVLHNGGSAPLQDVFVKGLGPQGVLAPAASLRPVAREDALLPDVYEALLKLLPEGAALARNGGVFHVSLPPGLSAGLEP